MVTITKQILEQCKQTRSDPHLAMLLYRATPLQSGMASLAELLSQRRHEITLPIKNKKPVRSKNHRETMAKFRDKREEYSNKKAADYRQLHMHETVYVQLNPDNYGRRQTSLGHQQKTTRGATRSNYQPDNASPGIVDTYG